MGVDLSKVDIGDRVSYSGNWYEVTNIENDGSGHYSVEVSTIPEVKVIHLDGDTKHYVNGVSADSCYGDITEVKIWNEK